MEMEIENDISEMTSINNAGKTLWQRLVHFFFLRIMRWQVKMENSEELQRRLSESVVIEKIPLSCNFVLVYKKVWDDIENRIAYYTSDQRREWDSVSVIPTEKRDIFLMVFSSEKRDERIEILIEIAEELEDVYLFRAYSLVSSTSRRSTLESFVHALGGMWFPRLRYNFMDELSGHFSELFRDSKVEMNEFIINVFQKGVDNYPYQKTMRAWVEKDGDMEYDLLKSMNLDRNRIVNLQAGRFVIRIPNKAKIDFRIDHTSRLLLSSTNLEEFRKILGLIQNEIVKEFGIYKLKQLLKRESIEDIVYVEFTGTDTLRIKVNVKNWFETSVSVLKNAQTLIREEKIVPFILADEVNPVLHVQLVDLEAQSRTNVYLNKDQGEIVLAPHSFESSTESISKIVNLFEKTLGAGKIEIHDSGGSGG